MATLITRCSCLHLLVKIAYKHKMGNSPIDNTTDIAISNNIIQYNYISSFAKKIVSLFII